MSKSALWHFVREVTRIDEWSCCAMLIISVSDLSMQISVTGRRSGPVQPVCPAGQRGGVAAQEGGGLHQREPESRV